MEIAAKLSLGKTLLRSGIRVPPRIALPTAQFSRDWRLVHLDVVALGRKLRDAGLYLFPISHASRAAWGCGVSRERAVHRAILRAVQKLSREYSAAELLELQEQRWLGMWCVRVKARACHVQADPILALSPTVALLSPVLAEPLETRAMAA